MAEHMPGMFAIGCLLLLVLPIAGLLIGMATGGATGGLWGAIIGFLAAAALSGTSVVALVRARRGG